MLDKLNKLIAAISVTDRVGLVIQLIGIIVPIAWAYRISQEESKKTKKEFKLQNKILDERQSRLEVIQESMNRNISILTEQQVSLSKTQKSVEKNLRELTHLAKLTREANLLNMQSIYPDFFKAYKHFEEEFRDLEEYKSKFFEEGKKFSDFSGLFDRFDRLQMTELRFFKEENVPFMIYRDFIKLKKLLWKNSSPKESRTEDYFNGTFNELQKAVYSFQEKLYP